MAEININVHVPTVGGGAVGGLEIGQPQPVPKEVQQEKPERVAGNHEPGPIENTSGDVVKGAARIPIARLEAPDTNGAQADVLLTYKTIADKNSDIGKILDTLLNRADGLAPTFRDNYDKQLKVSNRELHANLGGAEIAQISSRLGSKEVAALQQALREGPGLIMTKDRALHSQVLTKIGSELANLQREFGAQNNSEKVSAKQLAAARRVVDEFVKRLDGNIFHETRTVHGEDAQQQLKNVVGDNNFTNPQALAKLGQSEAYPSVCEDFVKDAAHSRCALEHADGSKEWLVSPQEKLSGDGNRAQQLAVDRISKFSPQQSLTISRLLNQNLFATVSEFFRNGPGRESLGSNGVSGETGQSSITGAIVRDNGDGTYTVRAHANYNLSGHKLGGEDPKILNPNLSHFELNLEADIDANGKVTCKTIEYDHLQVPSFTDSADTLKLPDHLVAKSVHGHYDAVRDALGIAVSDDLNSLDIDRDQLTQLTSATSAEGKVGDSALSREIIRLGETGAISREIVNSLQARLELIDLGREQIDEFLEGGTVANTERLLDFVRELSFDLRLLEQDLSLKAEVNWGSTDLNPEQAKTLNTITAALAVTLERELEGLEEIASDRAAALDDARGDIDEIAVDSKISRVENTVLSLAAVHNALTNIGNKLEDLGVGLTENDRREFAALKEEVLTRLNKAEGNLQGVREGSEIPLEYKPGLKDSKAEKLYEELRVQLAAGEPPPTLHEQLSERQLVGVLVSHFAETHPIAKNLFKTYEGAVKHEFSQILNSQPWDQITQTFNDIDDQDRLSAVTSVITPGPSIGEAHFARSYGGKGVNSSERQQGEHVSNLALTKLTDSDGKAFFAGLRHGILDGYNITVDKLAKAPEEVKIKLLKDTICADNPENAVNLVDHLGDERVVGDIRRSASANMAIELVTAAVVGNPALLARAQNGQDVEVILDSVSLVTPDILRPLVGKDSEKEMLKFQRVALRNISGKRIQIEIDSSNGKKLVEVKVGQVRTFNTGVNDYALATKGFKGLLNKLNLLGWSIADKMNSPHIKALVGKIKKGGDLGGEALEVVKYLEGDQNANLSESQKAALQTIGGEPSAFADPKLRADAIRTLAAQIKDLQASNRHHRPGSDPYKLPARLALLSNLLGHSTAFNCKSGKDRTGQLDAEVKYLAKNFAAGNMLPPDVVPNRMRKTNFVLKSGNLEVQQLNTGLRGFRLQGMKQLFQQLNSDLARKLFPGDSLEVKE